MYSQQKTTNVELYQSSGFLVQLFWIGLEYWNACQCCNCLDISF